MQSPRTPVAAVRKSRCSTPPSPSTTPTTTSPRTMTDEGPVALGHRVRGPHSENVIGRPQHVEDDEGDRADDHRGPDDQLPRVAHARAGDDRHDRDARGRRIAERSRAVLGRVGAVDGSPLPDQHSEQHRVGDRELLPVGGRRVRGEDGEDREDPHLQKDEGAIAAVLTAVQLVEQGTVEPGDPDQPEDDGEIDHARPGDVLGKGV